MFTVCPKCALTLVVTAADLRVAQGYVRCGRCSSVFNALARLTEERQPAGAEPAPAADTVAPAAPAAEAAPAAPESAPTSAPAAAAVPAEPQTPPAPPAEEPISEDALEFNPDTTDVNSVFVQPPPDPQWTAATGSFRALVAANQDAAGNELPDSQVDVEIDAAFLASMLRAETPDPVTAAAPTAAPAPAANKAPAAPARPAPQPLAPARAPAERPTPQPKAGASTVPPAARPTVRHSGPHARAAAAPATTAAPVSPARVPVTGEPGDGEDGVKGEDFAGETTERSSQALPLAERPVALQWLQAHAWAIGAVLAALLLMTQVTNHYRDELAASARFHRPLSALYGSLGVKLFPRWDLHAYDVRQLGASADAEGGGTITVRASIKNGAPQPQPLPMLRVTLQDRFGNRIAARDVQPRSYLPGTIPASSFLSAGQRIDAEMGFADPGTDAVGFEIDACLPARGGGVACANDATLR